MSIATVVTRGYIGGVNFIPPRGYLAGGVVPSAQSGIQRLINQAVAADSVRQANAWIKNPIREREVAEEEFLLQMMFEYYKKHLH